MAALTDPDRLKAYRDAMANWQIAEYVQFALNDTAYRWVRRELDGISLQEIRRLMAEHVAAGGEIDEVREKRPEWSGEYEFHHDLRIIIQGQSAYIETRLHFRPPFVPDKSWIEVVNIHAP